MKKLIFLLICLLPSVALAKPRPVAVTTNHKYAIHLGSFSIDSNNHTQAEIDSLVATISANIPNVQYIAIGTYLDYPDQIRMYADAIHANGKKVWFRSAGFTTWQGRFGSLATGTPAQHRADMVSFIENNYWTFAPGDIFEAVPDEPENGNYWYTTYGSLGIGTNVQSKQEFNDFITGSITDANAAFIAIGRTGIDTSYVFTSPSVSKDIITDTTASQLTAMGTDNYPEGTSSTYNNCYTKMKNELTNWAKGIHGSKAYHITLGANVNTQLNQSQQANCESGDMSAVKDTLPNYDGITIWQSSFGNSRLFDFTNGQWVPRSAVSIVNNFFAQ